MISSFDPNFRVSGESFFDYFSCKTRLWFESRNIDGDFDKNEHIKLGKFIDESTFDREKQKLVIPGLCSIDFIRNEESILEVHEVKKGKKFSKPQIMQTMYYVYIVRKIFDEECKGFLHLPEVRKKMEVILDLDIVEETIQKIRIVINGECPKPEKKSICHGCSYRTICWC